MHKFILSISLLLILTIGACSGVRVSQDYDLGKPLPMMKTYQWQAAAQTATGDVRVDNPFLNERIRLAIERMLNAKGFKKAVGGDPDFLVAYQFTIKQKIRTDDLHSGIGVGVGAHGRHGGLVLGSGPSVSQVDQGYLVIDLTAADSRRLLWRGKGTRYLPEHANPEKTQQIYNELVEKILEQFPPKGQRSDAGGQWPED